MTQNHGDSDGLIKYYWIYKETQTLRIKFLKQTANVRYAFRLRPRKMFSLLVFLYCRLLYCYLCLLYIINIFRFWLQVCFSVKNSKRCTSVLCTWGTVHTGFWFWRFQLPAGLILPFSLATRSPPLSSHPFPPCYKLPRTEGRKRIRVHLEPRKMSAKGVHFWLSDAWKLK